MPDNDDEKGLAIIRKRQQLEDQFQQEDTRLKHQEIEFEDFIAQLGQRERDNLEQIRDSIKGPEIDRFSQKIVDDERYFQQKYNRELDDLADQRRQVMKDFNEKYNET